MRPRRKVHDGVDALRFQHIVHQVPALDVALDELRCVCACSCERVCVVGGRGGGGLRREAVSGTMAPRSGLKPSGTAHDDDVARGITTSNIIFSSVQAPDL